MVSRVPLPSRKRYERIKVLGEGSFGKIYLVNDRNTGEMLVEKAIPIDTTRLEDFKSEVLALEKLKDYCNKYVLCYKDNSKDDKNYYLMTEYIPNSETLEVYTSDNPSILDLLSSDRVKDAKEELNKRAKIICNLVHGIKLIHDLGIVHFDIKPENILVNPIDLSIKYIDFGLACPQDCDRYFVRGSTEFIAPEILFPIRGYNYNLITNQLTDLWSLGITIYELLTSDHYYDESEAKKIRLRPFTQLVIKDKMNRTLYKFINEHQPLVLELLAHLLSVNPSTRYISPDFDKSCLEIKDIGINDKTRYMTDEDFDISSAIEKVMRTALEESASALGK